MEIIGNFLESITEWAWTMPVIQIYVLFGIIAILENVIPPIPGDLIIAFTGYMAATGVVGFLPMLFVNTIGGAVGFISVYYIARIFGDDIQEQRRDYWLFKYVNKRHYDRVNIWMNAWGQGAIIANRFILGMRTLINVVSGVTRMHPAKSFVSATISVLMWNITLMSMGWIIAENWEDVGFYLDIYGRGLLIAIVIIVAIRIIYQRNRKYFRKRRK